MKTWIIGIRLDPASEAPTWCALLAGEDQTPAMNEEQLILFSSIEQANDCLDLAGVSGAESPADVEMTCDFATALYLLENEEQDNEAIIINCLNVLFDFVKSTHGEIPKTYNQEMLDLADHLTFRRSLSDFFNDSAELRSTIIDGILWSLGWVITHAKFLQPQHHEEHEAMEKDKDTRMASEAAS